MPAHNVVSGYYNNSSFGFKNPWDCVYIPVGSDKGDCPHCYSGVLFRNAAKESEFKIPELYTCDICGRDFIEGINMLNDWFKYTKTVPRRHFVEVYKK